MKYTSSTTTIFLTLFFVFLFSKMSMEFNTTQYTQKVHNFTWLLNIEVYKCVGTQYYGWHSPAASIPTSFCSKSAVKYTRPADHLRTHGTNISSHRVMWEIQSASSTSLLKAGTLLLSPPSHQLAPYCYYTNILTLASFLLFELKSHKTHLSNCGRYN